MGKTRLRFDGQLASDLRILQAAEGSTWGSAYTDVQLLIEALADYGDELEGHEHNSPSKPLLASRPWAVYTLRRTPPNEVAIQASAPPVLRIPYAWVKDDHDELYALVLFVADKSDTQDQDQWYDDLASDVVKAVKAWLSNHPDHRIMTHEGLARRRSY